MTKEDKVSDKFDRKIFRKIAIVNRNKEKLIKELESVEKKLQKVLPQSFYEEDTVTSDMDLEFLDYIDKKFDHLENQKKELDINMNLILNSSNFNIDNTTLSEKDIKKCIICSNNSKKMNIYFLPCFHKCICNLCIKYTPEYCPCCGISIESTKKI